MQNAKTQKLRGALTVAGWGLDLEPQKVFATNARLVNHASHLPPRTTSGTAGRAVAARQPVPRPKSSSTNVLQRRVGPAAARPAHRPLAHYAAAPTPFQPPTPLEVV